MKKHPLSRALLTLSLTLLVLATLISCVRAASVEKWKLPKRLNEVSGLALSADGRLFLHNDEKAIVYEFDRENGDVFSIFKIGDPSLKDDFEGLAIIGSDFYLLTSRGTIHRVSQALNFFSAIVESDILDPGLVDVCEFEGISSHEEKLYLICKKNYADQGQLLIFVLDPLSGEAKEYLNVTIASLGLDKFHPSGISVTAEEILIVAARQGLLTRLRHDGSLVKHHKLKKKRHYQTEGIVVTRTGSIILADEAKNNDGFISIYGSSNEVPPLR